MKIRASKALNRSQTISLVFKGVFALLLLIATPAAAQTTGDVRPLISTHSADKITDSTATLHGYVNPFDTSDTVYWFEYGSTPTSLGQSTGQAGTGGRTQLFEQLISGLSRSTTYYFRAVARNSYGTSYGAVLNFRTYPDPQGAASTHTQCSNGFDDDGDGRIDLSDPQCQNSADDSEGNGYNVAQCMDSLDNDSDGLVDLADPDCATSYDYTESGTRAQPNPNPPALPTVMTRLATEVTGGSAKMNGEAVILGGVAATGYFEWGTSFSALTNKTTLIPLGANITIPYFATATGLQPNTTYYFRAVAENTAGASRGSVLTFTTTADGGATTPAPTPTPTLTGVARFTANQEIANKAFPNGTKTVIAARAQNTIEFSIAIKNTGTQAISGGEVRDLISEYFLFVDASDNAAFDPETGRITWKFDLAPGTAKTFTARVKARVMPENVVAENKATITANGLTRETNSVMAIITTAPLIVNVSAESNYALPGETVRYTVDYKNEGDAELKNASLRVVIPTGLNYNGASIRFDREENILSRSIGVIPAGGAGRVTVDMKVGDEIALGDQFSIGAIMSYADAFLNVQDDVASYFITIIGVKPAPEAEEVSGGASVLDVLGGNFLPDTLIGWAILCSVFVVLLILLRLAYSVFTKDAKTAEREMVSGLRARMEKLAEEEEATPENITKALS